jgi:parallel beta-helix repeat protein
VVTVVEGKVQVTNRGKSVLVGAGTQTTIPNNRPPSPPVPANLTVQLGWLKSVPNTSSGAVVPPVLSLPIPVIVPVPLPAIAPTPTMTITDALESTNWSGVVLVDGSVTIPAGATVNVAPGTVVEMANNAALSIKGTLSALGTAAAPIIVTSASAQPAPNDWEYLDFNGPTANASVLSHVQVFYGGYAATDGAEVSASNGASPTISDCIIAYSSGDGLYLDDGSQATVTNCVFAQNGDFAVGTTADDAARISGSRLGPNQSKGIEVLGETIAHSGAWHRQDVPYALNNGVKLAAGARIDIDAGTVILMNNNASLSVSGTLVAHGTAAAPVIFTSAAAQPGPNDWQFIDFTGNGASGSVLDHVQVFYGGYSGTDGAEVSASNGASPTISNSAIEQSNGDGLYLDDGDRAVVENCAFAGNTGYAVSTSADNASLISGTSVAAGQTGIEVRGNAISHDGTWQAQSAPFQLNNGVVLNEGVSLHIAPGTIILMNNNASFSVSGTLLAEGTAAAPITVSSAAAQPAPNDWEFIDFNGPTSSASRFTYVDVSYGGYAGSAGAEVSASNGASPAFVNSVFTFSNGDGLYLDDGDRALVTNCAFANNGDFAISTSADNAALITGTASAAGQTGIEVRGNTVLHPGTWQAQSAPFELRNGVTVGQSVVLTIQAGTVVDMLNNASLSVSGTLHVEGSAAAPIVFTSAAAQPAPNDWEFLNISGSAAAGVFDHVYVEYGGYAGDGGAELSVENGAALTVTHSVIAYSNGDGVYADEGTHATVAFNSFHDNGDYAISLPAKDPTHVHDNTYVGGQKGLEIR